MQKVFVSLVLGLTLVLGACSSLIPDQTIGNPFGLDGKTVTLEQAPAAELNAQAVQATYSGSLSSTFPDFEQSIPGGVSPSGISENLGIETDIRVSSATATSDTVFPDSLTIVASQLSFTVTDGSGTPSLTKTFKSAAGLSLVMTKGSCQTTGGVTCTYTLSVPDTVLLVIQLLGADISTFFNDILDGGGEPNTLTGNFSLTVSGDTLFPEDSEVTVKLNTTEGTLTF